MPQRVQLHGHLRGTTRRRRGGLDGALRRRREGRPTCPVRPAEESMTLGPHLPEEVIPIIRGLRRSRVVDVSNGKRDGAIGVDAMDVELRVPGRI